MVGIDYLAITLINYILGRGSSHLLLHLISFTLHLFIFFIFRPQFINELLENQYQANKRALEGWLIMEHEEMGFSEYVHSGTAGI